MAADMLLAAARSGNPALLAEAISKGADVNMILDDDCGQWTPLHFLAAEGDADGCKLLLDAGAIPSYDCTTNKYHALHLAARNGHIEAAECLIRAGAEVDHPDANGYTPLHYAAAFDHALMANILLRKGASATIKDTMGCTAAQLAKAAGHTEAYSVIVNSEVVEAEIGRVAQWLASMQLIEHFPKFLEAGLNDLQDIADVGLKEADLDKLGIFKVGDRIKIMRMRNIQQFLGPNDADAHGDGGVGGSGDAEEGKGEEGGRSGEGSSDEGSGDDDDDDDSDASGGSDDDSDEGDSDDDDDDDDSDDDDSDDSD